MNSYLTRPPRESDEEDLLSEEPNVPDERLKSLSETRCPEPAEGGSTESTQKSSQVGFEQFQDSSDSTPKSCQVGSEGATSARTESLPKSRFLHRAKKVFFSLH